MGSVPEDEAPLEEIERGRLFWHTDYYERRDGRWQAVWSHATRIRKPRLAQRSSEHG